MSYVPAPSGANDAVYHWPVSYENDLQLARSGKPAGDEVQRSHGGTHAQGSQIDDLVGRRASGLDLADLVGGIAGVEEDIARPEHHPAVVELSFREVGRRPGEPGDVVQAVANDSNRVESPARHVRGASDHDDVRIARQEGQAAVRGRQARDRTEVRQGIRRVVRRHDGLRGHRRRCQEIATASAEVTGNRIPGAVRPFPGVLIMFFLTLRGSYVNRGRISGIRRSGRAVFPSSIRSTGRRTSHILTACVRTT